MKFQLYQPLAIQELGSRKNQEDSIYPAFGAATPSDRLFLVCDGMGGHDKGEVASAAVCKGMSEVLMGAVGDGSPLDDRLFEQAIEKAYDELDAADTSNEGKMGTTMTALCMHRGGCLVAHIGDSRIYHLRPSTGEVLFRSRDHSLVQQLYEMGELSYYDMFTSPRKNIILKAMQPHQEERVKASLTHITDVREGDYFYLCSDGMLEEMDDDELMELIGADGSNESKVDELIRRTTGNADNHSAYLIEVKSVTHEDGDHLYISDEVEARRANKALNDPDKSHAWDDKPFADEHATVALQPKASRKSRKKFLYPAALLLVAGVVVAVVLLLTGGKKNVIADDAADDADLAPQMESVLDMIMPTATQGNNKHDEAGSKIPENTEEQLALPDARPYLEKKTIDKGSPVKPDSMPASKPKN